MAMIVVKIVEDKPEVIAEAKGVFEGTGFEIVYESAADMIGVDAVKIGDGEQTYGAGYVIVGKK